MIGKRDKLMIIFDLDGTLADCEHRRHFVDPNKNPHYVARFPDIMKCNVFTEPVWLHEDTGEKFKPDWKAFYEACDLDKPIEPVIKVFNELIHKNTNIEIWSGRCESVKDKTIDWLTLNVKTDFYSDFFPKLKMRPEGLDCPQERLFEHWLRERSSDYMESLLNGTTFKNHNIQMAFLSHKPTIDLFRRHGIFVFDCAQNDEEF